MKADAWQAIFSGGTFLAAAIATLGGLIQLSHFNKQRREETRPYVIVDFYFRQTLICISVQNTGRSPAENVKITFDPELQTSRPDVAKDNFARIGRTIPMLAPNRRIVWLLDSSTSAFKDPEGLLHSYKAQASYSELTPAPSRFRWMKAKAPRRYSDPVQNLDLQQYEGALLQDTSN